MPTSKEMAAEVINRGLALEYTTGYLLGIAEGRALALAEVLELRFGPIPVELRSRITAASSKEIDRGLKRVFSAGSPEEVFAC